MVCTARTEESQLEQSLTVRPAVRPGDLSMTALAMPLSCIAPVSPERRQARRHPLWWRLAGRGQSRAARPAGLPCALLAGMSNGPGLPGAALSHGRTAYHRAPMCTDEPDRIWDMVKNGVLSLRVVADRLEHLLTEHPSAPSEPPREAGRAGSPQQRPSPMTGPADRSAACCGRTGCRGGVGCGPASRSWAERCR